MPLRSAGRRSPMCVESLGCQFLVALQHGGQQVILAAKICIDRALGQSRPRCNRIDGGSPEAEPPERFIGSIHDPPANLLGLLAHAHPPFISILVSSFTVFRPLAKLLMAHSGTTSLAGDVCHATASLTFRSIQARPIVLKLKRPVVARIATIAEWPLILIDLLTEEGIVGRSYLEPYTVKTMRYLVPALQDFGEMLKGRPVAPYRVVRTRAKVAAFRGLRRAIHDCGVRTGHGGMGCARQGQRRAVVRPARRLGWTGEGL